MPINTALLRTLLVHVYIGIIMELPQGIRFKNHKQKNGQNKNSSSRALCFKKLSHLLFLLRPINYHTSKMSRKIKLCKLLFWISFIPIWYYFCYPHFQIKKNIKEKPSESNLTDTKIENIAARNANRLARLHSACENDKLKSQLHFQLNQLLFDSYLSIAGCIPPKTGSTTWNTFWWPTANWQHGTWEYNSWQDQGNTFAMSVARGDVNLEKSLHSIQAVFMQTRHPISRLISGKDLKIKKLVNKIIRKKTK